MLCHRETRYFKTWKSTRIVEQYGLPPEIREVTRQRTCSFGNAALLLNDAVLAAETCEELFTPLAPHIALALSGVEIITNGSGSHHQVLVCVAMLIPTSVDWWHRREYQMHPTSERATLQIMVS